MRVVGNSLILLVGLALSFHVSARGNPLDRFIELSPANEKQVSQPFEYREEVVVPAKYEEIADGLMIVVLTIERELKSELTSEGYGGRPDFEFHDGGIKVRWGGQFAHVIHVQGGDDPNGYRFTFKVVAYTGGSYRELKEHNAVSHQELEQIKFKVSRIRQYFQDAEKLKKLSATYDKLQKPRTTSEFYEAVAIWQKQPVINMSRSELIHVFGEPDVKAGNVLYYRKEENLAQKVTLDERNLVSREPEIVTIDGDLALMLRRADRAKNR